MILVCIRQSHTNSRTLLSLSLSVCGVIICVVTMVSLVRWSNPAPGSAVHNGPFRDGKRVVCHSSGVAKLSTTSYHIKKLLKMFFCQKKGVDLLMHH